MISDGQQKFFEAYGRFIATPIKFEPEVVNYVMKLDEWPDDMLKIAAETGSSEELSQRASSVLVARILTK